MSDDCDGNNDGVGGAAQSAELGKRLGSVVEVMALMMMMMGGGR